MAFFTGYLRIFAVIAVVSSLQALADTDFQWNKVGELFPFFSSCGNTESVYVM
jgi:hypothetical protein